jgi:predicted HicB family RNase H-like nuclease
MIEYKGYTMGPIEIDVTDDTLSATVAGLKDVIYFEGSSATELQQAFRKSIDDYLALCADRGRPPDRPYKGAIALRTAPELHRKAALRAAAEGVSLNEWISRRIAEAA